MLEVTLTVTLNLMGPVLSHATAIGKLGFDAHMARDRQGHYYLPFSLIRGRLRQAWEEIHEAAGEDHAQGVPSLDELLGPRTEQPEARETSDYQPRRGNLRFTDFKYTGDQAAPEAIYRIRMDAERGAADEGAMQIMESPFAPGQPVSFTGEIGYSARDPAEVDTIQAYIHKGLRWIPSLGGERTLGFGRLIGVSLQRSSHQVMPVSSASTITEAVMQIAIRPQAPFCVSKRQIAPNLFESDIMLSGGVLRGTIATMLKRAAGLGRQTEINEQIGEPWRELGKYFNRTRITHAFPAIDSPTARHRPVVAPLSLVKDADDHLLRDSQGKLCDVSLCDTPGLIGTPRRAPAFAVDWKTRHDVDMHFGWPAGTEIKRELRVRTEIDRHFRRAKDERLFAYEMIVPHGLTWYSTIDLRGISDASERAAVAAQLRTLLRNGLHGIGKTKVSAKVNADITFQAEHPSQRAPIDYRLWVVTLQTPALLCDPSGLDETSGHQALKQQYASAWQDLSNGALSLVRFFASQSLAGGYQVYRFQAGKPYNPFLLTDAGSVFVLQAASDVVTAQAAIESWLDHGLALPSWAQARYGATWQTCPFLPEDGFGEIAVNLDCHQQPDTGVFDAI
jgi:hypothetical protein